MSELEGKRKEHLKRERELTFIESTYEILKNSLEFYIHKPVKSVCYLVFTSVLAEGQSGFQDILLLLMLVLTFIEHLQCAKAPH